MQDEPKKPRPKSNKRGGARPGSGRKTKQITSIREGLISETDRLIVASLPGYIANLQKLAFGGYERVEEVWEAAPATTKDGKPNPRAKDRMVLRERRVSIAEPDRAANIYLIDRILGKPRQNLDLGPDAERRDGTMDALREIAERGRQAD